MAELGTRQQGPYFQANTFVLHITFWLLNFFTPRLNHCLYFRLSLVALSLNIFSRAQLRLVIEQFDRIMIKTMWLPGEGINIEVEWELENGEGGGDEGWKGTEFNFIELFPTVRWSIAWTIRVAIGNVHDAWGSMARDIHACGRDYWHMKNSWCRQVHSTLQSGWCHKWLRLRRRPRWAPRHVSVSYLKPYELKIWHKMQNRIRCKERFTL